MARRPQGGGGWHGGGGEELLPEAELHKLDEQHEISISWEIEITQQKSKLTNLWQIWLKIFGRVLEIMKYFFDSSDSS